MNQEEFFERIRSTPPDVLAQEFIDSDSAHIFPSPADYQVFREKIDIFFSAVEHTAVVGSGNWRYSLNPEKGFREFGKHSDVDVAIISTCRFHELWDEMRQNHRKHFYGLPQDRKDSLRRNSENVYAGFISPSWIPNRDPGRTYRYKQMLNELSDQAVQFLKVKLMFFKNADEAIDYYTRGFRAARRSIQ